MSLSVDQVEVALHRLWIGASGTSLRDEDRKKSRELVAFLRDVTVEVRQADVADVAAWPTAPDVVVALHACGPASDGVIDAAIAAAARLLYLVPCCTGRAVAAMPAANAHATRLGIPRHAAVRVGFAESVVAAERTLRLEAAGYETTVAPLVPPTVTPYHLIWRARRVLEPTRMARAAADHARLIGG